MEKGVEGTGLGASVTPIEGRPLEISLVIPIVNAVNEVVPTLQWLSREHSDLSIEVIFVGAGGDGKGDVANSMIAQSPFPIRLIHGERNESHRGFAGAVLAGLAQARGVWAVVLAGDPRYPSELAPRLAEVGRSRDVDVVIAARLPGSALSTMTAKVAFPRRLGRPGDPTSGFFAVRRAALDLDRVRSAGFSILLEILVRHPGLRMAEVPVRVGPRSASPRDGAALVRQLVRLRACAAAPSRGWLWRAVAFGLVGISGLVVNTAVLWLLYDHFLALHYLLAAALATEASTTWLFVLTETLVYTRAKPGAMVSRAIRFFLLNHALLALRLPVLALGVDVLGLDVLLANGFTLGLLFVVRFAVADSVIYGRGEPVSESVHDPVRVIVDVARPAGVLVRRSPDLARYLPYRYAIPGVATIGSQVPLAELEYFRAQWLGNEAEIQIRIGRVGSRRPLARAVVTQLACPPALGYSEHLGRFGANFRLSLGDPIEVVVSPALGRSPHVVYTNVLEALLRFVAASRDVVLLHSACLELDGVGMLISARTDTGKTGTVLRLIRERGAKFLSDDMTVLYGDGRVGCFPKPLTISRHTLRAVQSDELPGREWRWLRLQSLLHSREGRRFGLALSHRNVPIMSMNALTQRLVPPPKYAVDRLLPCEIVPASQVTELFVLERGPHAVDDVSPEAATSTLLANTEDAYQFPPFRHLAPSIVLGGSDQLALREKERQILASALHGIRARSLSTPDFTWADEISRLLATRSASDPLPSRRYA